MAILSAREKRCEDCACLIKKNGRMACDECFGQFCDDIDDCPEGMTLEEQNALDQKAKENKVGADARAEKSKTERKPRTVVISDEKQRLFAEIFDELHEIYGENAKIEKENKLIIVKIGEKTFKIDLIETRKKKS